MLDWDGLARVASLKAKLERFAELVLRSLLKGHCDILFRLSIIKFFCCSPFLNLQFVMMSVINSLFFCKQETNCQLVFAKFNVHFDCGKWKLCDYVTFLRSFFLECEARVETARGKLKISWIHFGVCREGGVSVRKQYSQWRWGLRSVTTESFLISAPGETSDVRPNIRTANSIPSSNIKKHNRP